MGNNSSSPELRRYPDIVTESWQPRYPVRVAGISREVPEYQNAFLEHSVLEESKKSSLGSSLDEFAANHYEAYTGKVKMLPNTSSVPKLRATDNGFALHNAGTITERRVASQAHGDVSELSFTSSSSKQRRARGRKKYKAPPAPQAAISGNYRREEQKARLFKMKSDSRKQFEESKIPERTKSLEHLKAQEYHQHSLVGKMGKVEKLSAVVKETQPQKQFYFGMTDGDLVSGTPFKKSEKRGRRLTSVDTDLEEESRKVLEEFDAVLDEHKTVSSDEKSVKNYRESSEGDSGIALNLRPTLPRKQLQLPRFSPSAAWRSLGIAQKDFFKSPTVQQSSRGSEISEDEDVFEERITRSSRRMAPPRLANEKSADSGISRDAGSPVVAPGGLEKPLAMSSPVQRHATGNWIPEQDLDETSSETDPPVTASSSTPGRKSGQGRRNAPPKFMSKSQMFSPVLQEISLKTANQSPGVKGRRYRKKDQQSSASAESSSSSFLAKESSLRRIKRSISNAAALRNRTKSQDHLASADDNWLLSRSAPNSIHNGLDPRAKFKSETDLLKSESSSIALNSQYPAISQPSITQRIVYLPQYDSKRQVNVPGPLWRSSFVSGPFAVDQMKRSKSEGAVFVESRTPETKEETNQKKFKFQSTLRMQQKKVLEAKLSREAEEQEKRRLQELEAMKQVEEEFQRKRAAEKAKIRLQLQRLQLEASGVNRHPPYGREDRREPMKKRLDPEGAPAVNPYKVSDGLTNQHHLQKMETSSPLVRNAKPRPSDDVSANKCSSPVAVEVLSEYRQQRREYRDYRSPRMYMDYNRPSAGSGSKVRGSPRGAPHKAAAVSDNYRWDFARRGSTAKPTPSPYKQPSDIGNESSRFYRY